MDGLEYEGLPKKKDKKKKKKDKKSNNEVDQLMDNINRNKSIMGWRNRFG